ncbi:isopenicillin N synthase family dioxygenase [Sabulicella rubraurantiaca]|uniref:isopenicillin N synthase family dioxygenase n=1 Tax=Sabulicella rubraurantiaca TaxID=2811429 RepID=UPI001A9628D7|nr:2-oxoglutarate and iron-dependent oxygenase domain-containing protein [Sabulicella rubraurantiaca]
MALPIIDISGLRDGSEARQREVAARIGATCRETGFFLATGHGVDRETVTALFGAARRFFALPAADKEALSIRHSPHNRGYVALGEEQLDPSRPADRKEAFNIGLDLAPDDAEIRAGLPFRGVNLWPSQPRFREATLAYFNAAWTVARLLHRGFALDLGLREGFFEDKLDRPLATLRLLRYPAGNRPDDPLGAGEHTDYGNVTVLANDGMPGLELRRRDGVWVEVPRVAGAFVCNIGDCLMRWTNGAYASTPHRVHAPSVERFSVAFFCDPNPDAVVAAIPSCTGPGNPPRWPPITAAEHLRSRLDATYAHRRKAAGG